MKRKVFALSVLSTCIMMSGVTLACSNMFIAGKPGIAAVARTMDLEINTGNKMGYGERGVENTSNINLPQKAPLNALKWTNKYAYLGQTAFYTYVVLDGINSQGLYAGFLDLPSVSRYPTYNVKDTRPELGVTDTINYVLGTSNSVPEALENLNKAQIITNGFALTFKKTTIFGGNAIHLVLRDKLGNNAVIEWTSEKGKPMMHTYFHKAGTNFVMESTPGFNPVKFKNVTGWGVTNSPAYDWQLHNIQKYNYVFNGASNRKWDGLYMNGSGMAGVPGDWTPPGRLARSTQLARLMPTPNTEAQAMSLAWMVLQSMAVPVGANPSPAIWDTMSDLKNNVYYFKVVMSVSPNFKTSSTKIALAPFNMSWARYAVADYATKNVVPKGWMSAQVKPGLIANKKQVAEVYKGFMAPTPHDFKMHVTFKRMPKHRRYRRARTAS